MCFYHINNLVGEHITLHLNVGWVICSPIISQVPLDQFSFCFGFYEYLIEFSPMEYQVVGLLVGDSEFEIWD